MKRRNARIMAMMALYDYEIHQEKEAIILSRLKYKIEEDCKNNNISYDIDESLLDTILDGVIKNQEKIDYILSLSIEGYVLDRVSYLDRCLLRIGAFEIMYTKTPNNIIVNEIIEISKCYTEIDGFKSSKFNNAVLQKIIDGKYREYINE